MDSPFFCLTVCPVHRIIAISPLLTKFDYFSLHYIRFWPTVSTPYSSICWCQYLQNEKNSNRSNRNNKP